MNRKTLRTLTAGLIAGAFLLPTLGHAAGTRSVPSVSVTPTNFTSAIPAHLAAGPLQLRVTTPGAQDGTSVNLARLLPGAKPAQVRQLMRAGNIGPLFGLLQFVGGVDSLHATTQTGYFNLTTGTYVAFSLDRLTTRNHPSSPSTFITVSGRSGAAAPQPVGTIKAVDFKFHGPTSLPAGLDTVAFTNAGHSPHELVMIRIDKGKTLDDVKMALMNQSNGPPPAWAHNVGGWGVISPGTTMWPQAKLIPGNYVILCFVPDQFPYPGHKPTHKPHFMLGMIRLIQVR